MPRAPTTPEQKRVHILRELRLNNDLFKITAIDGTSYLQCAYCDKLIKTITMKSVRKHISGQRHQYNAHLRMQPREPTQADFEATTPEENSFFFQTGNAFVAADICFEETLIPEFKEYLEMYTQRRLPHPSTLRKRYLDTSYCETIRKIREEIGEAPIWLSVDETQDHQKRNVANAIVTPLLEGRAGKPRIIHCQMLKATNNETIINFVNESLSLLWPDGIRHDRVLIFITDAAPYMRRAGNLLKETYPKMIHVTCIAHALQRVVVEIREEYRNVNQLIADVKAVFSKAPTRTDLFREVAPGVPLPPDIVVTRWKVWLQACAYYCTHLNAVEQVLNQLDPAEALSIGNALRSIEQPGLEQDLNDINDNFGHMVQAITRLERRGLPLQEARETIEEVCSKIQNAENIRQRVRQKLTDVFEVNLGWRELLEIHDLAQSGNFSRDDVIAGWTEEDARLLEFAPSTSSEVERSFSVFKGIFRLNRSSFEFENLSRWIIVSCYVRDRANNRDIDQDIDDLANVGFQEDDLTDDDD